MTDRCSAETVHVTEVEQRVRDRIGEDGPGPAQPPADGGPTQERNAER
jgi:hypothetical protein